MSHIFLDAADFIKNKNFEVLVPSYYKPYVTSEDITPKPLRRNKPDKLRMTPLFDYQPVVHYVHENPDHLEAGLFSIEIMMDMFERKVVFTIMNDKDTVDILDGIDRYMEAMYYDVSIGRDDVVNFIRKMVEFRNEIYKHYYRYMKMNPTAEERLHPNHSRTENVLSMINNLGLSSNQNYQETDPLKLRANPIYNVDDVIPKEIGKNSDNDFHRTFGLPETKTTNDEIIGIDFSDFLKR